MPMNGGRITRLCTTARFVIRHCWTLHCSGTLDNQLASLCKLTGSTFFAGSQIPYPHLSVKRNYQNFKRQFSSRYVTFWKVILCCWDLFTIHWFCWLIGFASLHSNKDSFPPSSLLFLWKVPIFYRDTFTVLCSFLQKCSSNLGLGNPLLSFTFNKIFETFSLPTTSQGVGKNSFPALNTVSCRNWFCIVPGYAALTAGSATSAFHVSYKLILCWPSL